MIEVDQLTKHYGSFTAVNEISFQVGKGEILGFLGPNGAGKSTTMKMLTGFITPSSGTARVGGHDIISDSIAVREMIGYLPESAPSYKSMTVYEFLSFIAEVRGYSPQEKKGRVDKVLETTSLQDVRVQTIETLSKGYRQRVGFAQALIHDPPVLILDEPTDGLDPNQKHEVRNLIKNMSKDKVIILSTHILEEMEAVCSRAIIINEGNIVADGSPEMLLTKSVLYNAITMTMEDVPNTEMITKLEGLEFIEKVELSPDGEEKTIRLFPKGKQSILAQVNHFIADNHWNLAEIHQEKGQMDEVFRTLTVGASH